MSRTHRVALTVIICSLFVSASLAAAPGVGQLSLDRTALASILAAEMPNRPVRLDVQPMGTMTLKFSAPTNVSYVEGGVEARLNVRVVEAGMDAVVTVRFWPEVDPNRGVIRLKPVRATGEGPLAVVPDIAPFLQPVELPRVFAFALAGQDGSRTSMNVVVQEVYVKNERLEIKFQLAEAADRTAEAAPR